MAKSELIVRQVRSHITSKKEHVATLRALGIGKINSCSRVPDNEPIRGMLFAVSHLVEVTPVE